MFKVKIFFLSISASFFEHLKDTFVVKVTKKSIRNYRSILEHYNYSALHENMRLKKEMNNNGIDLLKEEIKRYFNHCFKSMY
jgi:hypothetical protein